MDKGYPTFGNAHGFAEGIIDQRTGKRYPTSTSAMLECEHFDDLKVYTEFTKQGPTPAVPLAQLYQDRISSLREQYDYVELSWGGGHDSTMILKAAEQANCRIDLISMQVHGDPATHRTGFNSEISENLHHVESYVERFPGTEVRYLDIDECYAKTIEKHHDHALWCSLTTMEMLDDICRIGTDHFVPERNVSNGVILSGQGWKNAIHNRSTGTWSLFLADSEVNQLGAISFHLPTVRFYETHDIMIKVGEEIRNWFTTATDEQRSQVNITGSDHLWTTNNEWVHEEIMYKGLHIFHDSKSKDWLLPWQEQHRFSFWTKENDKYKEYYQWIAMLNKNMHTSCFLGNGGILGDGRKYVSAATIDF